MAISAICLVLIPGCNSPELKSLENEVNDLRVEVFRQQQAIQELTKIVAQEEKNASSERTKASQFRADAQESLRQIRESTRAMSNRLDPSGTAQRSTATPARTTTTPTTTPAPATNSNQEPDQRQLSMAEKDFNSGDFEDAVDAADTLLKYFPDSELVPEALYLKGRALYAMKSYGKAQEAFQKLCNEHPDSSKFRVSRLNVGKCQSAQGNTMAAIATFEDIATRWPSSQEARSAKELIQDMKSGR
jgi:tol-pal system protein YbgF